jgi:hypothetical protein
MHADSSYEKSGSTSANSSSANVSGTQPLMAANNQESSSNRAAAISEPNFIVHQGPLAPKIHQKVTNLEILWPF